MSASLMAGMTGATITEVGNAGRPTFAGAPRDDDPAWRHAAPWSAPASHRAFVTDSATLTRLRSASRVRISRSRRISADLVTMPTGCPARSSTSEMPRMT